ncbi:MAG TPA: hypothetical protein VLE97_07995 [Gaiellaceae bacterium]|nr:hypothetical protein [Gaiellaceae bacterium]
MSPRGAEDSDYSWEADWPRITVEYQTKSVCPRYWRQESVLEERVEITREEYERTWAEWDARLRGESDEPPPVSAESNRAWMDEMYGPHGESLWSRLRRRLRSG